jgi:hypothetical protein
MIAALGALPAAAQAPPAGGAAPAPDEAALRQELTELRGLVTQLQHRIDDLETRLQAATAARTAAPAAGQPPAPVAGVAAPAEASVTAGAAGQPPPAAAPAAAGVTAGAPPAPAAPGATAGTAPAEGRAAELLRHTTFSFLLDAYYTDNFNYPIGRDNLLRAYDVSSNSFSLNQIDLVMENAPDPAQGRPFGARVDLQWGQATQSLQGNPLNEGRPEIYRDLFQAYGTWIAPLGSGLTVDLGKWASALGIEGNYTKDQMNYSRSFWFTYLPYYHTGLRLNYSFGSPFTLSYWLVNGAQNTEALNNFKDQLVGATIRPLPSLTLNLNYYVGQEHPDVIFFPNGGAPPGLPTLQGVPFEPIRGAPNGRTRILDGYLTWQLTPALTAALEGDFVTSRLFASLPVYRTPGWAAYLRYQATPRLAAAVRAEALDDQGGLFSGVRQRLDEGTLTAEYRFTDGFLARAEWRRDHSDREFFLTDHPGLLVPSQETLTLGTVWWFGGKEGPW